MLTQYRPIKEFLKEIQAFFRLSLRLGDWILLVCLTTDKPKDVAGLLLDQQAYSIQ